MGEGGVVVVPPLPPPPQPGNVIDAAANTVRNTIDWALLFTIIHVRSVRAN